MSSAKSKKIYEKFFKKRLDSDLNTTVNVSDWLFETYVRNGRRTLEKK